jgi:hypothetical protein
VRNGFRSLTRFSSTAPNLFRFQSWEAKRLAEPVVPDPMHPPSGPRWGQRSNLCLKSRNKLSVPRLPDQRGAMGLVSAMSSGRPAYEPAVWLLLVEWIGSSFRKRYRPPVELPQGWLTRLPLVTKLEIPVRDIKGEFEILT